jgi:hypothetical protein
VQFASPAPLRVPSGSPAATAHQLGQGGEMFSSPSCTTLAEPALIPRTNPAAVSTPMANTAEKGPSLSGAGADLAPPTGVVGPACLTPERSQRQGPHPRGAFTLRNGPFSLVPSSEIRPC